MADGPKAAIMKNYINSYDQVKNAIESGKAGNIFNLVDGIYVGMGEFEYSDAATIIFDLIKAHGEGFVIDICNRVLDSIKNNRPIIISDKQRWCLAFAALKISASCVDALYETDRDLVSCETHKKIENNTTMEETHIESIFCVRNTNSTNSSSILETTNEEIAKAEFAKWREQLAQNTPVDVSRWTDDDQGWHDVYFIELIRIDIDDSGDVVDMETLEETPYYRI